MTEPTKRSARRTPMTIPPLAPHEKSWVVSRLATDEVLGEFFDRRLVEHFNPKTCRVETIGQYLARFNRQIKEGARP